MHQFAMPVEFVLLWLGSPQPEREAAAEARVSGSLRPKESSEHWSIGKPEGAAMKTFTIDADGNISVFSSVEKVAQKAGVESFHSLDQLMALAGTWPANRLVKIWNSLTGVTPVKKFRDRSSIGCTGLLWADALNGSVFKDITTLPTRHKRRRLGV